MDYGNDCIYYKKCILKEECCKRTADLIESNKKLLEEHEKEVIEMTIRAEDWDYWDGWKVVYDIKNDNSHYNKTNNSYIRKTLLVAKSRSGDTAIIYTLTSNTGSKEVMTNVISIDKKYKEEFKKDMNVVFGGLDEFENLWKTTVENRII